MALSEANPCEKCKSTNVSRIDICQSVNQEDPDNIIWVLRCGDCFHRYLEWYIYRPSSEYQASLDNRFRAKELLTPPPNPESLPIV